MENDNHNRKIKSDIIHLTYISAIAGCMLRKKWGPAEKTNGK